MGPGEGAVQMAIEAVGTPDPLKLESESVVSCPARVVGTKLQPSASLSGGGE